MMTVMQQKVDGKTSVFASCTTTFWWNVCHCEFSLRFKETEVSQETEVLLLCLYSDIIRFLVRNITFFVARAFCNEKKTTK